MIAETLSSVMDVMFAPRRASSSDDSAWHPMFGGGDSKRASLLGTADRRALALDAVCCATRVISEGIAMLPLDIREHVNDRETRTAYEHPLWPILHDQPNPEMDKFTFFDMQIPLQVNAGDAFSEIQRNRDGSIAALWPIHKSRVTVKYGPVRVSDGGEMGADGSRVYVIRNDDGTTYGIEARDMLHVPGALSENGICGTGLVRLAARALKVVEATEDHVQAFYENGATPDVVITFPASIPKEEKDNLRESWSRKHAGAKNAHKMLMMGGGGTADTLGISPKDSLLIDGRKFNVAVVSRFWRVAMHFLSELDRATLNNIEVLGIDFVTFTLGAWIARWEQAMKRQLLTPKERLRYSFKFNVNALMRGDSAARSQFMQRLFDMAMLSPNEGRELEDMNPIPGGDRHFILANNRVPLDRIDDIALLNAQKPSPTNPPPGGDDAEDEAEQKKAAASHLAARAAVQAVLASTLSGLSGYEARAVMQKAESPEFTSWCSTFYGGKFRDTFTAQVSPLMASATAFHATTTFEEIESARVHGHCTALRRLHGEMQDKPMRQFVDRVQAVVDEWAAEAPVAAANVFPKIPMKGAA